jgi:nitrate/nitrite transport system ATP-binding protein
MTNAFLKVEDLSKNFDSLPVFERINFSLSKGEFVCIIGHSGCGKSTILNTLAGLDSASSGAIFMDGREIAGPGLERGVVFQSHALMPWLTVLENITFAVKSKWPQWSCLRIEEHAHMYIELVGLASAQHKKPHELSGGMKQRVGIARAFSIQPKMLLLDEPFGALDALTRGVIQDELIKIWSAAKQTVFMITHDIDEAILLADRIFLMTNGPYAQLAEIVEVPLERPRSRSDINLMPAFYPVRNYLLDFLINRSRARPPSTNANPSTKIVTFPAFSNVPVETHPYAATNAVSRAVA